MLCQAFSAADFSCCLFVGLSAFSFVFSKWNACSIVLRSGDWLGHCRIIHFFTFKNSWVAFPVCFGSLSIWRAAQSTLLHLAESGQTVYPCTLQNSSGCFCPLSLHHLTPVTQCHWKPCTLMPSHCSTMYHRWCCVLWSWAVPSLLHTFFFLSFWYRLILISAVQRILFQKWSGFFRCFLAKSNLAFFAPCGESSVFALVKSSLDCRLWQWHTCLLESVLLLAGCCERVFLYHREDPPIIHHCCPPCMDIHAFLCCWAHQCVLFFSECSKLLIWPLLMFLLSLWWIRFVFEA